MMPSGIQRRELFTTLPTKGSSTSASSISATTKTHGACFSHADDRHLHRRQRGDEGDGQRQHVALQEEGLRVGGELRVVGQRDRGRIDHHHAQQHEHADHRHQRLVEGRQAHRAAAADSTLSRTGSAPPPSRDSRRGATTTVSADKASVHACPRSCGQRLHGLHEDLGAVAVVAEHVQAGAGRAQQHGVAGARLLEAPGRGRFQRGVALQGHAGRARPRWPRRRGRPAWPPRARGAPAAPPAARSPGPCRRRRGSPPACAGALSAPRPSSAATVAPTLVPLLSS